MSTPGPEPAEPTRREKREARRKARAEAKNNLPTGHDEGGDKKSGDKKAKKGKGRRR